MSDETIDEVAQTIEQLQRVFQAFTVGGLHTASHEQIAALRTVHDEFQRVGARHIADQLQQLLSAVEHQQRDAAALLMRAQASVRLFERILTLDVAQQALAPLAEGTPR